MVSLPVQVCRSKTLLLKLPYYWSHYFKRLGVPLVTAVVLVIIKRFYETIISCHTTLEPRQTASKDQRVFNAGLFHEAVYSASNERIASPKSVNDLLMGVGIAVFDITIGISTICTFFSLNTNHGGTRFDFIMRGFDSFGG